MKAFDIEIIEDADYTVLYVNGKIEVCKGKKVIELWKETHYNILCANIKAIWDKVLSEEEQNMLKKRFKKRGKKEC